MRWKLLVTAALALTGCAPEVRDGRHPEVSPSGDTPPACEGPECEIPVPGK